MAIDLYNQGLSGRETGRLKEVDRAFSGSCGGERLGRDGRRGKKTQKLVSRRAAPAIPVILQHPPCR